MFVGERHVFLIERSGFSETKALQFFCLFSYILVVGLAQFHAQLMLYSIGIRLIKIKWPSRKTQKIIYSPLMKNTLQKIDTANRNLIRLLSIHIS